MTDGQAGATCDTPTQVVCNNQCSGHGTCWLGFCSCHHGYWGHDCAHRNPDVALPGAAGIAPSWLTLPAVPHTGHCSSCATSKLCILVTMLYTAACCRYEGCTATAAEGRGSQ